MTRTKRQHFVPRFYLAHFADPNGNVWTYDIREDRAYSTSPENTGVETNIYSVEVEDGKYFDEFETCLAKIEDAAAALYPKVLRGERLLGQERADFAVFVASLYARSPAMLRIYGEMLGQGMQFVTNFLASDPEKFNATFDEMERDTGRVVSPADREAAREFMRDKSGYTLEVDRRAALPALGLGDHIAPLLFKMEWIVAESEHQHLITSDNPVVRVVPPKSQHPIYGDGGFMNKGLIISLPLSPNKLLEMGWHDPVKDGTYPVPKQRTRLYNRQRAHFAERYLYASNKDYGIIALARKHKKPGLGIKVSGGGEMAPVAVKRRLKGREES